MNWNPHQHPRDDDGKFASGGGGGGGAAAPRSAGRGRRGGLGHLGGTAIGYAASHNSGSRGSDHGGGGGSGPPGSNPSAGAPRGMPDTLASAVAPMRNGNLTVNRGVNNGLTLSGPSGTAKLDKHQAAELKDLLKSVDADRMDNGEEYAVKRVDYDVDGIRVTPAFLVARTGDNSYDVRVGDGLSYDELRATPPLHATGKDMERLFGSTAQLDAARRVETGSGEMDVFIDDDQFAFRTLGGDGQPVEAKFNAKSFAKLNQAVNVVMDGFDEGETFVKGPAADHVTSVDVPTNLGKVNVHLVGDWGSNAPGSRLTITPHDGSWGFSVDGPHQAAWADAVGEVQEVGEEWGIYNRFAERKRTPHRTPGRSVPLTEATATLDRVQQTQAAKGRFKVLLIKAGWGSSGYYSEALLKRDGPATWPVGTRMHLDHQTAQEAADRPEGSVRDWASEIVSTPAWDPVERGLVAEIQVFPQWRGLLNPEFASRVGLSIRASGRVQHGEAEGRQGPIVESLEEGISVDWVTQAGAGGRVLELIESARLAEKNAEREKAAPPGKAGNGRGDSSGEQDGEEKGEGQEPEDDEDTTAKKKGKLPAFLKTKEAALGEAVNVGHWMESRIHKAFTELADDAFGDGRLTRDERIGLSQAVGDGLKAFAARLEADHPHLYRRDPWAAPEQETQGAPAETTTMKGAPVSGSTKEQTPDRGGLTINELTVTESTRERQLAADLAEATKAAETAQKALTEAHAATAARVAALEATLAESAARAQRLENDQAARKVCAEALKTSGLPEAAHAKVVEAVVRDIPAGENGVLDGARLAEAVKAAIQDEKAYLAAIAESAGLGQVRGLGESRREIADSDIDSELEEAFKGLGMSDTAAKVAAHGRA